MTVCNSCVHYCSIKSCVHICHVREKNIEHYVTIKVGFTGLKKFHEYILNLNSQLNDRMTSLAVNFRFRWKFRFQKFLMHQKIRREISGEVFRAIFDLRPHLVVDILNFEPIVTQVTIIDATVKL